MDKSRLEVEGEAEVLAAFNQFSDSVDDLTDVNSKVGQSLLGPIRTNTRRATGQLAQSWEATGEPLAAQFSNVEKYAVVQEFGGSQIEPTLAVSRAFEDNQDAVIGTYSDGIKDRAKRANIRTS